MAKSVKNSKNFMVGTAKQRLCRTHLPSIQEVLAHFRYEHEVLKFTISKSCNSVARTVHGIWKNAGFFPREEKNVCRSLMKLVAKWQRVKKQKETASEHMQFQKCMKGVFDIAVKNVESLLDKDHLSLWRKQKTSGVPIRLKKYSREKVQDKIEKPMKSAKCSVEGADNSRMTDDEDPEFVYKQRTRRRIDVMTDLVAENLDREKVSNRGSVGLLGSTAAALGYDLDNLRLSKSTSHRKRKQARQRLADAVKVTFKKSDAIVVHFDSKQLLDGRRKREKLAVVVTGNGSPEQILSCEFIEHGTGRAVAEQVVHCLEEWGLTETIKAKSYDTTSVNSGQHNGASVIVSQLLGRQLLELPCRHHVYELVLMSAYKTSFNMKTSAPDDTLFKQFRVKWNSMDHSKYNCLEDNSLADTERSRLVAVFEDLLDKPYHRDDYAEFLQLGLMCLSTTKKFQFRPPGAMHHARWMAKGIYCLKMFLFRKQFEGEGDYQMQLKKFVLFVVQIYMKAWYTAPLATSAPRNDLHFLEVVSKFKDKEVRKAVLNKFKNHLWYLSEVNVALAFFDEAVTNETKRRMVKRLSTKKIEGKNQIRLKTYKSSYDLSTYVSRNTLKFFEIMNIKTSFLSVDPSEWKQNEDFTAGKKLCETINVTNDCAERAIALCSTYNQVGPKNDKEKNQLILGVAHNRRNQRNSIKTSVANYFKTK